MFLYNSHSQKKGPSRVHQRGRFSQEYLDVTSRLMALLEKMILTIYYQLLRTHLRSFSHYMLRCKMYILSTRV